MLATYQCAAAAEMPLGASSDERRDQLTACLFQFAWDTAFTIDPEKLLELLRTNAVGPAIVSQVALPFLEKGRAKKLVHITSTSGSIATVSTLEKEEHRVGGASYSTSKTALNMIVCIRPPRALGSSV